MPKSLSYFPKLKDREERVREEEEEGKRKRKRRGRKKRKRRSMNEDQDEKLACLVDKHCEKLVSAKAAGLPLWNAQDQELELWALLYLCP